MQFGAGTSEIEREGYSQFAMCLVTLPSAEDAWIPCTDDVGALALTPDRAGITSIDVFSFAPDGFVVEILKDGEPYATEDFLPEYTVDEPNGPGCGERRVASLTMTTRNPQPTPGE